MAEKFPKKILAVLLEWDYGDKARGPSAERAWFFDNLSALAEEVEPFWYDGYLADPAALRLALLARAESFRPDLIFFLPYQDQFDAATLDALKGKYATCAWFGDDTWRFDSFSSKLAPHFTHVCTTDPFSLEKYRALGVAPILTQWAAQPLPGAPAAGAAGDYRFDVSFIGARNSVRAWFIDFLRARGVGVECFGHGWPGGKVAAAEMAGIFAASRINLNLSNSATPDLRYLTAGPKNFLSYLAAEKRAEQIKARNFEIPLAGGFQLTNYVAGLERYLEIGREVAVFASPEECAAQARYYLAHDAERRAIAAAGLARAERDHTYLARLREILGTIWPRTN